MKTDTTYSEVIKYYKEFSDSINADLKFPKRSDIASGGARKNISIEIEKKFNDYTFTTKQTFAYLFSDPENLAIITGLKCMIKKKRKKTFTYLFGIKDFLKKYLSQM